MPLYRQFARGHATALDEEALHRRGAITRQSLVPRELAISACVALDGELLDAMPLFEDSTDCFKRRVRLGTHGVAGVKSCRIFLQGPLLTLPIFSRDTRASDVTMLRQCIATDSSLFSNS